MHSRDEKQEHITNCIDESFAKMRIDNPEDLFVASQCFLKAQAAALSTMNNTIYGETIGEVLDTTVDLNFKICRNLGFALSPYWPKDEESAKPFFYDVLHGSLVLLLSKAAIMSEIDSEKLSMYAEICKVTQQCVATALVSTIRLPGRKILSEEDNAAITESVMDLMQETSMKFLDRWQGYIKEKYGVNMSMGPLFEE